jgi:hypothetical protein
MTIRYLSFDFDGCLFNSSYIYSVEKDLIKSNFGLLNSIKNMSGNYTKNVVVIGSSRQSYSIDIINSPDKGSCFPALNILSQFLQAEKDDFLLADIYGDLDDGTSYARAIDDSYTGEHANWHFDDTKVSVLYAQMQRAAFAYSSDTIVFEFYDDRSDIIVSLGEFYQEYKELIPANITLNINSYNGGLSEIVSSIQGTGLFDKNYRQTVKDMANTCIKLDPLYNGDYFGMIQVARDVQISDLIHRSS